MASMEERIDGKIAEFASHLSDVFQLKPEMKAKLLKQEFKAPEAKPAENNHQDAQ